MVIVYGGKWNGCWMDNVNFYYGYLVFINYFYLYYFNRIILLYLFKLVIV